MYMLQVWSNGLYKPTPHRVINADPYRSRVSIPFFYEPCYEAIVDPPVELASQGTQRYAYCSLWTNTNGFKCTAS